MNVKITTVGGRAHMSRKNIDFHAMRNISFTLKPLTILDPLIRNVKGCWTLNAFIGSVFQSPCCTHCTGLSVYLIGAFIVINWLNSTLPLMPFYECRLFRLNLDCFLHHFSSLIFATSHISFLGKICPQIVNWMLLEITFIKIYRFIFGRYRLDLRQFRKAWWKNNRAYLLVSVTILSKGGTSSLNLILSIEFKLIEFNFEQYSCALLHSSLEAEY